MNPEIKKRWITALTDGSYEQGEAALRSVNPVPGEADSFCCLGVLCDLYAQEHPDRATWDEDGVFRATSGHRVACAYSSLPPTVVAAWAELGEFTVNPMVESDHGLTSLAQLNDDGYSFEMIAELIDTNL